MLCTRQENKKSNMGGNMRTAFFHNFLIESTLISSVAIILMMIIRKSIRSRIGNKAICYGWLLVAVRLLVPISIRNPWIIMIRSPMTPDIAIRPIAGQLLVRTRDALLSANLAMDDMNNRFGTDLTEKLINSINSGTAGLWLLRIYITGIAIIVGWFVFSNVRFNRKIRLDRIVSISGNLLEQYESMCKERGIKPIPVIYTDPLPSACLLGTFRPYIALPLLVSQDEASYVLAHEICHLKNRDHLWSLLRLICCAVHWFNPLVWIAADMSRTDIEIRCDDSVIRTLTEEQRNSYADILVKAAAQKNSPGLFVLATGMTMAGRKLKTRVMTVLNGKGSQRRLTVAFCILASVCLVLSFATSELPGQISIYEKWDPHYAAAKATGSITLLDTVSAVQYANTLYRGVLGGNNSECTAIMNGTQFQINGIESETLVNWQMRLTDKGVVLDYSKDYSDHSQPVGLNANGLLSYEQDIEKARSYVNPIIEYFLPGLGDWLDYLTLDSVTICDEVMYISFSMSQVDGVNDYIFITVRKASDGTMNVVNFNADGNG